MKIDLLEVGKITLGPNDVLAVTITSDEIGESDIIDLKNRLQTMFPDNRIMMSVLPTNSTMDFQVISKPKETHEL